MRLFFIRHGQSEANVQRIFSNRGVKHGLTETGKAQARRVAKKLEKFNIDKLYASTLLRARQTAEIIAEEINIPYSFTDKIKEIDFGILEDKYYEDKEPHFSILMLEWFIEKNFNHKIDDGETYYDVKKRFLDFIDKIKHTEYKNIAIVGHGALFRFMLPEIMINIDHSYSTNYLLKNTDYVIAESYKNVFKCSYWTENKIT